MSNRYEEVIRLVLDVESDKAEKKIVDAQDRANRRAKQRVQETTGPEIGRQRGPRPASESRGRALPHQPTAGGVSELYRSLGHVAGSLMRGQMPSVTAISQLMRQFGGKGGGGIGGLFQNLLPSAGRAAALVAPPSFTTSHAAAVHAGNAGTLGSGRPPGMPPTPPAPPRRTPPPIPPGAPPLPTPGGGFGGMVNRGVGLFNQGMSAIGGGGVAGAAGIAGLVLVSLKHLASGIGKYTNAIGLWGKAFITGDASKALKGLVSWAQGFAHMLGGPIFGALMSKVIGVYGKFIDALDGLVAALGKYSPIVNAQMRVLEVQQKMFRLRMANIFQPLMSAWIDLKSAVLDLMGQLAPLLRPIVNFFAMFVKAGAWFIREIKSVFIDVVAAFVWVRQAMMGIFESYGDVQKRIQAGFDQRSLSNAAAEFNKGVLRWANGLSKWQQNESTRRERPLWKRATSGDGSYIPTGDNLYGSRRFRQPKMQFADFSFQSGSDGRAKLREPGDSLPSAAKSTNNPSSPAKLPLTPQVSFNQKIENKFQLSIANDAAVRESMNQVRDKLVRGLGAARDEAQLVGSMLVASSLTM